MESLDHQPPRFVPTLTDVVPESLPIVQPERLDEVSKTVHPAQPNEVVVSADSFEKLATDTLAIQTALVESLMEKMQPLIEAQLKASIDLIVKRNTEVLYAQTSAAVQDALKDAVAEVLAESSRLTKPRD